MNIEKEIEKIDNKLAKILEKIEIRSYEEFTQNECEELKAYEHLLGSIEIGLLPKSMISFLDEKTVNKINQILDKKIEKLKIN